MGVSVSDTSSETRMATARVRENSRNSRSMMPPMNRMETNTATSERFIDSRVKPTSRVPCSAALNGAMPSLMCREMFSSTTMASSTTRPAARISAISESTLREKPIRYITAKVPTSDTGTASAGISEARRLPRNR
ncbi:hypothetical protein D3C76_1230590 [compost metagenome]